MDLIRGLYNLKPRHRHCIATIGNFDGVHRAHQVILAQLKQVAKQLNLPTMVITFEPLPQEYFANGPSISRLTRLREKLIVLRKLAIDHVLCLHFDADLSDLSPEQFIKTILVKNLAVKYLLVGHDFRFGSAREGDFSLLTEYAKAYGFEVVALDSIKYQGKRISSTRIRNLLAESNFEHAEALLGRPYSLCGRVAYGDKRGRQLGVPTANVYLHRKFSPIQGVFVVEVLGISASPIQGVANVGHRPTVDGTRCLLEVHLFDFDEDIYGRYVEVRFLQKLRDEKRYPSLNLLKQQIIDDIAGAKRFFKVSSHRHGQSGARS